MVVATRDRAHRLGTVLDALGRLPERPDVIVVDNGSGDGTGVLVRERYPHVRLIMLPTNRGATARNVGVAAAGTPYVAFADDDSWWEPGSLATAVRRFEAYPRLALIAARTLVGTGGRPDPVSEFMARAPLGREPDLPGPSVLGFLACAAVVRRDAFLAAGGYDPVVFFMGEEARLAYDLAAAGWGLAYCDDVVARHCPQGGGGRAGLARRNAVLTGWLRRPLRFALAQTRRLAADAVDDPAARRALAGVLARLPAALWHRRRPHPAVEAALERLAAEEVAAGYSTTAHAHRQAESRTTSSVGRITAGSMDSSAASRSS